MSSTTASKDIHTGWILTKCPILSRLSINISWINGKLHGLLLLTFLFIVTPIVGVCNCSMFCYTFCFVHSSIAIILMGKRELVALLILSSWCLVMVVRLFLAVPRG